MKLPAAFVERMRAAMTPGTTVLITSAKVDGDTTGTQTTVIASDGDDPRLKASLRRQDSRSYMSAMTALLFRIFAMIAFLAAPLSMAAPASAMTTPVSMSEDHCADHDGSAKKAPVSDTCGDCAATCSVGCAAIEPVSLPANDKCVGVSAFLQSVTASPNHEADRPPFEPPPPRAA